MQKKNYAPVNYVMKRDGRSRKYFDNLMRSKYNYNRVIKENGEIFVNLNYENPLRFEIDELYFKALEKANNVYCLARELSKYDDKQNTNRIYLYLRYGSFKHYAQSFEIKALLQKYLDENLELESS